jgi:beta-lactamase class A
MKYLFFIITVLITLSCTRNQESASTNINPSATPSVSPMPTQMPEKIDSRLETDLAKLVEAAKGRVGVGAVLVETGQTVYLDRKGQYPMQSVYKLPIAMAVLKLIDEGKVQIDQEVSITPDDFVRQGFHSPIRNVNPQGTVMNVYGIMRYSISESDGTASDVLLDLAGGPDAVMNYLKSIGINEVIVADSEKSISKDWETQYRNWATPEASIELLRRLYERRANLSEQMTNLLMDFMTNSDTGGRRIKRGLPQGASIAHKTGTGGVQNGITGATNDIGIITLPDGRHLLIAIYISDSSESGFARQQLFGDVARAIVERWVPGSYPEMKFANINAKNFGNANAKSANAKTANTKGEKKHSR